jgi:LPS sulfotransferase NodH
MRLSDEQLNSAEMDQPIFGETPRKLLILAPPRTGSSHLCRLMINAGIGIPHEYFNELHIRRLAGRFGILGAADAFQMSADSLLRYVQQLFAVRSRDGLFATKIQHKQYRLFIQNKIEFNVFDGANLVYLTRKDVLAQAVSWHFAELTGRWSFDHWNLTRPKEEADFYDVAAINTCVDEILAEQVLWEYFFHKNRLLPLRITYEDLVEDPIPIVQELAQRGGLSPAQLHVRLEAEGPYGSDPALPSKHDVIAHVQRIWTGAARSAANQVASAPTPG